MTTPDFQLSRRVLADAPVVILVLDLEGKIEHVNPFFERLTGRTLAEVKGQDWFDTFLPARERDHVRTVFARSVRGEHVSGHVNPIVTASGEERDIAWTDEFLRDESGRPVALLAIGQDLHAQRAAERALRANEERLRVLIESTPAGVAMLDRDLRYIACSRRWISDYRLEGQDVVGRLHYDVFPEIPERWKEIHRAALAGASQRCDEDRFERADGTVQYLRWAIEPWRDTTGAVGGVIFFTEDITGHKFLEERLKQAQALAHVGSWELDHVRGTSWWSDETRRIMGLEPDAPASYDLAVGVIHADDRARVDIEFRRSLERRSDYETEYRLVTSGGKLKHIRAQVRSFFDDGGKPLRSEGTIQDVSTEVGARLRLRAVLDGVNAFVTVCDLDGAFIDVNRAPLEFLQMRREDVVGKAIWELPIWPAVPGIRERIRSTVARAAAGEVVQLELTVHLGGRDATFDAMFGPLRDAAGRVEAVIASGVDVTDRVAADVALRQSLREKETLLREIHHRVKNNLQVVGGLLHFHAKKARSPEGEATFAELRQRIHAMTLVHELLYKARDVARVDVGEYVRAVVGELHRSVGPPRGVRIDVTADDVRLPVELALPVGMVVCELVTNVLKYAFASDRGGSATVSVRRQDDCVALSVDDDGVGFPPGLDAAAGGSFGWSLVRTLTKQIDGDLQIGPGPGAHVRVVFPVSASMKEPGP